MSSPAPPYSTALPGPPTSVSCAAAADQRIVAGAAEEVDVAADGGIDLDDGVARATFERDLLKIGGHVDAELPDLAAARAVGVEVVQRCLVAVRRGGGVQVEVVIAR